MKKLVMTSLLAVAFCVSVRADEENVLRPSRSPWSLRAGTAVRSVKADFRLSADALADPLAQIPRGRGNVGLYDGSRRVVYDDGYVEGGSIYPGGAMGRVHHASQLNEFPRGEIALGSRNYIVHFHTFDQRREHPTTSANILADDKQNGVGPLIELAYMWNVYRHGSIRLLTGWTVVPVSLSSGRRTALSVATRRTDYVYVYDYIADPSMPPLIPGRVEASNEMFVIDPNVVFGGLDQAYHAPRAGKATSSLYDRLDAVVEADLKAMLHEIPIGLEWVGRTGLVSLSVGFGGALTFLDGTFESRTTWRQRNSGEILSSGKSGDDSVEMACGVFGTLGASLPLTKEGRMSVWFQAKRRWMEKINLSAGSSRTTLDASGWQGAAGLSIAL